LQKAREKSEEYSSMQYTAQKTIQAQRRRKLSFHFDWFQIFAILVVSAFALSCLLPFWLVVSSSFTSEHELVNSGYAFFPQEFSTEAYKTLFAGQDLFQAYFASVFITVVGTVIALAITTGLAYVIANRSAALSRPLGFMVYFPMLFSGGLVPFYILVTQYLHLSDTWWAVILPLCFNPFFVFVMVSYFRQIPQEIIDAGKVDGASALMIFFRLVLPISTPILATIGLFYALEYWNNWFMALLFISDNSKYPLQLLLQNMIANINMAQALQVSVNADAPVYQLRMALTVLTIGPIILVYPFVQRFFIRGLTLGATKG
jgi:putative aldouronate transport system permease protein